MIQELLVIIIGGIHAGNGDKDPLLRTCFKHICIRFRLHYSGNQLHLELSLREKTVRGINLESRLTGVKTWGCDIVNSRERNRFSRKGRMCLLERCERLYHITRSVIGQSGNQFDLVFAVGLDIISLLFAVHQIDIFAGHQQ